jgi:hypothetical protein
MPDVQDLGLRGLSAVAWRCLAVGATPVVLHPLGFACVPVEPGLCVHVWLPGEPELKPDVATPVIHCHSWDLVSWVLTGRLGNTIHQVVPSLHGDATARLYLIDSGPDGDTVTATPKYVRHALGHIDHYETGDAYHLRAGTFHATYAVGATVTLLTATDRGGQDIAVGPLRAAVGPRIVRRRHASPELAERVTRLALKHLEER